MPSGVALAGLALKWCHVGRLGIAGEELLMRNASLLYSQRVIVSRHCALTVARETDLECRSRKEGKVLPKIWKQGFYDFNKLSVSATLI